MVLHLKGELDLASASIFRREIESPEITEAPVIVLDLQDLEFIDSTGLRTILTAHARSQEHGQGFAVTEGSSQVQRLLSMTSVGDHLRIITSSDAALV